MNEACNQEIYKNGIQVFLTHTLRADDVETWVKKISIDSGQKVDWHYFGGRAIILALGDMAKVREAILNNKKIHDDFFENAMIGMCFRKEQINKMINGIWHYNNYE